VYAFLFQEWNILKQPARFRRVETLVQVVTCCAILNNMIASHRRKEPAVPQPGLRGAALLLLFLVFFFFLLVLTCALLLKIDACDLSPSSAQAGAPNHVSPGQQLIKADTAVRRKKVVGLLGLRKMEGEAHRPGRMHPMIQKLAWMR